MLATGEGMRGNGGGVLRTPAPGKIHLAEPQIGRGWAQRGEKRAGQNDDDRFTHWSAVADFGDGIAGREFSVQHRAQLRREVGRDGRFEGGERHAGF